jgi:hypothetical protein
MTEKKIDQMECFVEEMRSGSVDQAGLAILHQLTQVLKSFKAHKALRDSSKTLRDHPDWKEETEDTLRQGPYNRRASDFNISHYAQGSTGAKRKPMLEFKVRTVRVPDFAWLNDTGDFEEPAPARVFRKTPVPKRAPPREPETIQGPSCEFPRKGAQHPRAAGVRPFEQKAEQHGGRTWEQYTAAITRLLQSAPRAETLVWRRGDDA